jgi:hypothetical protein
MQSILFLRETDDGEINRLINIDLLSAASPSPENLDWTLVICGFATITIHMPFSKFLEHVQTLIAENYRVSSESSIQWHKKRIADTEESLNAVLGAHLGH